MFKEYGGYLPLELNVGKEPFDACSQNGIARFNCGRNAVTAAALSLNPQKIYIPFYNCNVIRDTLIRYNVPIDYYFLDEKLEPKLDTLKENEWILYVNYFGISSEKKIQEIADKYCRVIFDNTQAFFAKPVLDTSCLNVYSPRKFVGLADGAYLIWNGKLIISADYPQDVSWNRASFLFKSAELGTNAAYQDNIASKLTFDDGIKTMSVLTQKMLKSLDYDAISKRRDLNYHVLQSELNSVNRLNLPFEGFAPFVYPLYIEDDSLRKKLVEQKIYVPQWWKYILNIVPVDTVEYRLSRWLLPLPVDQRYTEEDMRDMVQIIKSCI